MRTLRPAAAVSCGACIHSPPPPANQIVHVVPIKPAHGLHSMDVVWVRGRLQAQRQDSYMGMSGYHMEASKIEPYVPAAQRPVRNYTSIRFIMVSHCAVRR